MVYETLPPIGITQKNGNWFDQEVRMDHPLLNTAWSGADALIRVNKKDVPILQRYNEQVYSIPNGFPPAFHPIDTAVARERLDLPGDAKVVFTLGGLIKRKGFNYLIDAMDLVCSQRDDVLCFIGGAGPEKRSLERQIDRMRLGEKVKLLGSVPGDILPLWMNACDLFVLPSLNEGNPTVMFEALGCGKPFVGTKVGGVPEVITSGRLRPACRARRPQRPGGEDPGGAGPGVGSGEDTWVCGAVYVGGYSEGDRGCVRAGIRMRSR